MTRIRKILKLGLLLTLLAASLYIFYLSTQQDYAQFSPTRDLGRPSKEKEEDRDDNYMDFINRPPIELPQPF